MSTKRVTTKKPAAATKVVKETKVEEPVKADKPTSPVVAKKASTKKATTTSPITTSPTTTTTTTTTTTSTSVPKPTTTKKTTRKSKTAPAVEEKQPIQSICFYKELGVEKTATEIELKKAYYKKARDVHPDKNDGPEAKEEFQKLNRIYSILKDPKTRKFYDKHGDVEGNNLGGLSGQDMYEAWLEQYNIVRVSEDRIKEFFKQQEIQKKSSANNVSKDEETDLIDFYNRQKGDMKHIKEYMIGCETKKDVQRMCDHLRFLISKKRVKSYPIFTQTATFSFVSGKPGDKKEEVEEEEEEQEELGDEIGSQDEDDDEDDDEEDEEEEEEVIVKPPTKKPATKKVVKTPIKKPVKKVLKTTVAAISKKSTITKSKK